MSLDLNPGPELRPPAPAITSTAVEALLEAVPNTPDNWGLRYGEYDRGCMHSKLAELQNTLLLEGVDAEELQVDVEQSAAFIDWVFDEYEAERPDRAPGSFAFMVPTRTRRSVNGDSDGYMDEWLQLYPILRHVDSNVGQRFLVGTPPYVIDQYGIDAESKRGYMLFAPFFEDMTADLPPEPLLETASQIMRDSFAFAKRLGVDTIGLGATLPKLLFMFDKCGIDLRGEGVEITTGHAGTVWLIGEIAKKLTAEGHVGLNGSIGVLGAGSIGTATIAYFRQALEFGGDLHVSDNSAERLLEASKEDPTAIVTNNTKNLLESSDTIICAVTKPMRLSDLGVTDLRGKVIIDDSQPGCFDPKEVAALGGTLVWVIGKDTTAHGEMTLQRFDYSGYGPANFDEIWGCQLESWLVSKRRRTLGSLAITQEVKPQDVRRFGRALQGLGIQVADLQAQGQYLDL